MNYGSVCSGIEAATTAWRPLGWKAKFFAEVEPFPAAVLCHRYGATRPLRPLDPAEAADGKDKALRESWARQLPALPDGGDIPNLGDFTKIQKEDYEGDIDLLVGGTPCQSYSIAGLRKGLSDPRGNLALEFVRLAYRSDARWTVWENVPGVLSSGAGSDFASFLSLLCGWEVPVPKDGWGKCGIVTNAPGCYGLAWRILDAQYTRVPMFPRAIPQRRRRLFVVGYRGGPVGSPLDWTHPAAVLLDGEMREGDTPPRRETAQGASPASPGGAEEAGRRGVTDEAPETLRMREGCSGGGKGPLISKNVSLTLATANDQTLFEKKAVWWDGSEKADTLTCTSNAQLMPDKKRLQCVVDMRAEEPVCFAQNQRDELRLQGGDGQVAGSVCSMRATKQQNFIAYENHGNDSRVTEAGDVSPTLTSRMGTGGNNQPFVQKVDEKETVQDGCREGVFPAMRCEITPAVARRECFSISPCDANGTRADRPDGGLYVTPADASKTLTRGNPNTETVVVEPPVISLDGDKMGKADRAGGSGLGVNTEDVMYTQTVKDVHAVAYGGNDVPAPTETANPRGIGWRATVRRLLPVETERLMGFPDDFTRIPWKGKPAGECPDAPRYKACGNSMCVNVMNWIGLRIDAEERRIQDERDREPEEHS